MAKPGPRQLHETSDLHLAAFLRCRGFMIEDLRQMVSRVVFSFTDSDRLREALLDYANDGPIPARSFSNTLRDLKGLVNRGVPPADQGGGTES